MRNFGTVLFIPARQNRACPFYLRYSVLCKMFTKMSLVFREIAKNHQDHRLFEVAVIGGKHFSKKDISIIGELHHMFILITVKFLSLSLKNQEILQFKVKKLCLRDRLLPI